jgi:hypothetical protein
VEKRVFIFWQGARFGFCGHFVSRSSGLREGLGRLWVVCWFAAMVVVVLLSCEVEKNVVRMVRAD